MPSGKSLQLNQQELDAKVLWRCTIWDLVGFGTASPHSKVWSSLLTQPGEHIQIKKIMIFFLK